MIPHSEYPRPDFERSEHWINLNGIWDFAADSANVGLEQAWYQNGAVDWPHQIVVPYPWESKTSRINQEWLGIGWYRLKLERPANWANLRTILNFGAVHYSCTAWLNGQKLGEHTGGYLPFSFDISGALAEGRGELIVRVEAPLDKRSIPHGKQRSIPADDYDDCAFTASSGIWQTVWLEGRPATYIASLKLRPTPELNAIEVQGTLAGPNLAKANLSLELVGQTGLELAIQGEASFSLTLPIENPRLWSPDNPHLYTIAAKLNSPDGEDRVQSYTGLRKIEVRGERLYLNGQQLYIRSALDQGFWPEGIYTAPDDAALRKDVELALRAGYNLIRKHIKLENPRWLYWADKLGLLVWEEPPCTGRFSAGAVEAFEAQLAPMVARDGNHPSIIIWGIYNEEWGLDWLSGEDEARQKAVENAYNRLAAADATRPIIDDSGWWHVKTDILDWHYYDGDMRKWQAVTAALAQDRTNWFGHQLSNTNWYETRLSVKGKDHAGLPLINSEYGGGSSDLEQNWLFRWQTQDIRRYAAFSGYTYTELYDVEHEVVGIYTADRQLKDWGYDPASINAETLIIFDITPLKPGLDLIISGLDRGLKVPVQISHLGATALKGTLLWGWEQTEKPAGSQAVVVNSFEISRPIELNCPYPAGVEKAGPKRFFAWFTDCNQKLISCNFLDVEIASIGSEE